jgi:predicted phosphate transport protein (TIGR00153 family)
LKFSFVPRISFVPKEGKFFDLFEEGAKNLVKTTEVFAELVDKGENVPAKARQIKELEHQGDEITHRIAALLNASFITPIDREDITHLAEHIDDVLDAIEDAATCMSLYEVERPTQRAHELAAVIRRSRSSPASSPSIATCSITAAARASRSRSRAR